MRLYANTLTVALVAVICQCYGVATMDLGKSLQSLRETLATVMDDSEFAADMLEFQDQLHHFTKTKRTDSSVAVMKVATAQALISSLSHAIKGKSVEVCGKILDEYTDSAEDLNDANLTMARAFVRIKVTIIRVTKRLWGRLNQLIKRYKDADGMDDMVDLVRAKLNKNHLSITPELQLQAKALAKYTPSDIVTDDNLLEAVDDGLNDAFECSECSGIMNEFGISPLGSEDMVDDWVEQFVDEHFLTEVEKSEKSMQSLLKDESDVETTKSAEQIETELRS